MDAATIIAIAISLAMDAFSVSIAYGICAKGNSEKNALKMASSFGAFQMLMPMLGWFLGEKMLEFIAGFDHWIAFALLLFIGCRMVYESAKQDSLEKKKPLTIPTLFVLSIATSIDALAVGLSFAFPKSANSHPNNNDRRCNLHAFVSGRPSRRNPPKPPHKQNRSFRRVNPNSHRNKNPH